jgi:hypothetical protein
LGDKYELTVGIGVTDKSGNPVKSGTSDTAVFNGSNAEPITKTAAEEKTLTLESAMALESNLVELTFSEEVSLPLQALDSFIIAEQENSQNILAVSKATLNPLDAKKVLLETAAQQAIKYSVIASEITNKDGELIDLNKNITQFDGVAEESTSPVENNEIPTETEDKQAPEEVTFLTANPNPDGSLRLSWIASLDSQKDLADQMLYVSSDGGKNFDQGRSIGKVTNKFDVKGLAPGMDYAFKITTKDNSGNESLGELVSFKTAESLPDSGPGSLILVMLASTVLGFQITRRKNFSWNKI